MSEPFTQGRIDPIIGIMKNNTKQISPPAPWVPLTYSLGFLLRSKRLMAWSALLILVTFLFTWLGYAVTVDFVDSLTGNFFLAQPEAVGIWGWIKYLGWQLVYWSFLIISRIVAFYLAFLVAYSLSAPGYVFLSTAAEKKYQGQDFEADAALNMKGLLIDLWEGVKIGAFGIVVTIAALAANFIPGVGQIVVFLLYTYYSALMFVDYPSSRRRWALRRKIQWLRVHNRQAFRLGVFPALVSMVPVLNIFFIAMLFPLMTVHCTLNFIAIEKGVKQRA